MMKRNYIFAFAGIILFFLFNGNLYGQSFWKKAGKALEKVGQQVERTLNELDDAGDGQKASDTEGQEKTQEKPKDTNVQIQSPHANLSANFVSFSKDKNGTYLVFTVVNKGADINCELSGKAYDDLGNQYPVLINFAGNNYYAGTARNELPADVPLKVEIMVEKINPSATKFTRLSINCRSLGLNPAYRVDGNFTVDNLGFDGKIAEKAEDGNQDSTSQSIEISSAHRNLTPQYVSFSKDKNSAYFVFTVTNKGGDLNCELSGKAYDDLGNQYPVLINFASNSHYAGTARNELLTDVPLKVEIMVEKINPSATKFTRLSINCRSLGLNPAYRVDGNFTVDNLGFDGKIAEKAEDGNQDSTSQSIEISSAHRNLTPQYVSFSKDKNSAYFVFTVTNKGGDLNCELSGKAYDDLGNQYPVLINFASNSHYVGTARNELLTDVPLKVEIMVEKINPSATKFTRLSINCRSLGLNPAYKVDGSFTVSNLSIK